VSRYIVGQGRTYISCPDADPARLNVAVACSNLVAGRALVSMGLLTRMTVAGRFEVGDLATGLGETVRVHVRVLGPSWVRATHVTLFANGVKVREADLGATAGQGDATAPLGDRGSIAWDLTRPKHDVHLVAIATGPGVQAPFWAIPKPYQPVSPHWEGRVIGSTNPIWLDGDGDGRFTSARAYAGRLLARDGTDWVRLLTASGEFDEAVAAQAAALCAEAGHAPVGQEFDQGLQSAAPQVQRGFAAWAQVAK
jgi:hypothetical protein